MHSKSHQCALWSHSVYYRDRRSVHRHPCLFEGTKICSLLPAALCLPVKRCRLTPLQHSFQPDNQTAAIRAHCNSLCVCIPGIQFNNRSERRFLNVLILSAVRTLRCWNGKIRSGKYERHNLSNDRSAHREHMRKLVRSVHLQCRNCSLG